MQKLDMNYAQFPNRRMSGAVGHLLGLALVITLAGCATPQSPPPTVLLDFITDGQTTKQEIIVKLGEPSGRFESEKILTYRLRAAPKSDGYYVVQRETTTSGLPTWSLANFSLVLVFDDANVLRQHSLVKVNR